MKNFKHWLATMAVLLCSVAANAEDFEVGGIYYRISSESDRTVTVTHSYPYGGYSGKNVEIPSSVMHNGVTYRVTEIDLMAFYDCNDIKSITLPNSITGLVSATFYGCTGELIVNCDIPDNEGSSTGIFYGSKFSKVTIGEDVRNIGDYAFLGCNSITSLTIQDGVTNIGDGAFSGCSNINSITLPESVTSIGDGAFRDCCSLASTYIPNSVTDMGGFAFSGCTGKLTINCDIPDAESNNTGAFYNSEFSEIIIGDEVRDIGKHAFNDCEYLISVDFGEGVQNIGQGAFEDCAVLNAIILPNSVINIGKNAFYGCDNTASVVLPNSVTNIGENAFYGCAGELLVNCNIPSAVLEDTGVFYNSNFSKVTIGEDVISIGDNAFNGCVSITSLNLSQYITSIGDYAFSGCYNVESFIIPESVRSLGIQAFANCGGELVVNCDIPSAAVSSQGVFYSGLFTKVIIGDKVKTIGDYAFENCTTMKSLTLPESLETIGDYAFYCCVSLNSLTIPENVVRIGDYAFCTCAGLTKITCHSIMPPACGTNVFLGVSPYVTSLEIPLGSEVLYRSAEGWKNLFINTNGGEGDAGEKDEVEAVTGITLSQDEVTLVEGERFTLTATVLPSNATDKAVTWSSSKESVATVTNGVVTAKSTGVAIITAKVSDKEATCVVTVEKDVIAVTNIILSQEEATFAEGETLVLTATVLPSNATDKTVTWSSSKESVATVTNGVVTAIAPGTAVITAKAGDKEAICVVMVIAASGVDGMMADEEAPVVYDLQGRRVLNPVKGIYIVNGRKVIFK